MDEGPAGSIWASFIRFLLSVPYITVTFCLAALRQLSIAAVPGLTNDSGPPSLSEEALGESRNKADLDQQTQHCFQGCQSSKGVS